jgi:hypothetical protein
MARWSVILLLLVMLLLLLLVARRRRHSRRRGLPRGRIHQHIGVRIHYIRVRLLVRVRRWHGDRALSLSHLSGLVSRWLPSRNCCLRTRGGDRRLPERLLLLLMKLLM